MQEYCELTTIILIQINNAIKEIPQMAKTVLANLASVCNYKCVHMVLKASYTRHQRDTTYG